MTVYSSFIYIVRLSTSNVDKIFYFNIIPAASNSLYLPRVDSPVYRQANTLLKTTTSQSRTAMLLGARKIRWRLSRQHLSVSYTPSIKLNFHSLSQPKVDESDDFLPWLERKAGAEISLALSVGKSASGTSLFASKSITAGDCVLKVPYSVQLAPDNLVPELKDLLSDGVGDAAKLATVVLFEQRMGNVDCCSSLITMLCKDFFGGV
ncbi:hypothetical protein C1H46_009510 [Malus baccata]|uniref:SET domain-containing protein n=1 Tax=Malus baccata TaxID=106549 RepID=A0A540N1G9_MALBA|nr:hypothetical protein C1H46_009510 [Malus baccata]